MGPGPGAADPSKSTLEGNGCEYRPLVEYPDLEDGFVVAVPHLQLRYYFRFASTLQGGLIWDPEREEVVYVLVRESMVRTIGEKLLSALH